MLPAYGNVRSRWCVVHRVVHEIRDSATQLLLVASHIQAVIDIKGKRMFMLAQGLRFVLDHAQHHGHIDFLIQLQRRRSFNF